MATPAATPTVAVTISPVPSASPFPSIVGKWKSAVTPSSETQSFQLDFDIQSSTWKVDYTVFGDLQGAVPFVTIHIEGPYEITGPSTAVAGAFEGRFGITKKTLMPRSTYAAEYLNSLNQAATGFKADEALDITSTGFAPFGQYPVSEVDADYDILKVEGDKLYFGARPDDNNMGTPEKRPTALSEVFSVKY
ncbi:MAG: hypothetical protein VKO21_09450 [Candidatus Sericytochromatia bacterium]|nr:hypothetical protein [Candidatus Sericytochromatia bacterium]